MKEFQLHAEFLNQNTRGYQNPSLVLNPFIDARIRDCAQRCFNKYRGVGKTRQRPKNVSGIY